MKFKNHYSFFLLFSFLTIQSVLPISAAEWNQWRGAEHDGVSKEQGLLSSWPEDGPKLLWKVDRLGGGYSNFSFSDDMMFSLGDRGEDCFLYALNTKDGKEIWNLKVGRSGASQGNGFAGPRCTPATDGNLVFAIGQFGDLICAEAKSGKELWRVNTVDELGAVMMLNRGDTGFHWDFSISPIIDADRVILPIGGKDGTVIAFQRSGEAFKLIWRSKEIGDSAPYTSIVPVTISGVPQYLLFTDKRLAGLDAGTGKLLWSADREGKVAICSDPVYWLDGDDTCYLIASSAYNVGAHGFKVVGKDGRFEVEQIFENERLQSHHGGLVQVGGHYYFLTQNELVCVDPKTGDILWKDKSVGKGSILAVDGKLILRSEKGDGTIALVEINPKEYKEISRFSQPDRSDKNSWTYPLVRDGRLYIRDQGLLLCYEVK